MSSPNDFLYISIIIQFDYLLWFFESVFYHSYNFKTRLWIWLNKRSNRANLFVSLNIYFLILAGIIVFNFLLCFLIVSYYCNIYTFIRTFFTYIYWNLFLIIFFKLSLKLWKVFYLLSFRFFYIIYSVFI